MSFWQAFMSVYHDCPWLVGLVLLCSFALNGIFLYLASVDTKECERSNRKEPE